MSKLRGLFVIGALTLFAACGTAPTSAPCEVNPCQNDGICSVDDAGRVLCECAAGYTGLRCGGIEGDCNPDPCQNGGVCSETDTGAMCACPTGYSGATCETVDPLPTSCTPNPCLNNGSCLLVGGVASCTCAAGYSGPTCGVAAASCTPNPCQNGGTCALVAGVAECTCAAGYSGPTCAVIGTGCTPNPCQNGGTCAVDAMGVTACTCVGDYGGDTCSSYVPPGDLNLSTTGTLGRTCGDMISYSVTALTSTTATLVSPPAAGCLAVGDEVLLINLQGTSTSVFNTGNWELLKVQSIATNVVTFAVAKQRTYGDSFELVDDDDDANLGVLRTNQRVVLQRVPTYPGLVVPSGRALTADAWDGIKGGVFAIRVAGDAELNGAINMAGKGYAGAETTPEAQTGRSGESLRGLGPIGLEPNTGGGGGGVAECLGVGPGISGGGGGHGTGGGTSVSDVVFEDCRGIGGVPYGDEAFSKIFFGSGGGAGAGPANSLVSPLGGHGGNGGGIVMIFASGAVEGTISAPGQAGYGDAVECTLMSMSTTDCWDTSGAGGGGAGGSIAVSATKLMGTRDVAGGLGGDGVNTSSGNGGAGGTGRASASM